MLIEISRFEFFYVMLVILNRESLPYKCPSRRRNYVIFQSHIQNNLSKLRSIDAGMQVESPFQKPITIASMCTSLAECWKNQAWGSF